MPPDNDSDFISDLLDPDDDNDGLGDSDDPFAIDALNGRATAIPLRYEWENDGTVLGGFFNLGFTGLMSNGNSDYQDLFDADGLTAGGAAGVLTVDEAPAGTALGDGNNQEYAFQFGINVDGNSPPFVVHTRLVSPFAGLTPQSGQQMGLFLGSGDQDNYVEIALDGDGSVKLIREVAGAASIVASLPIDPTNLDALELELHVNPTGLVSASFVPTIGGISGPLQTLGAPVVVPASWFVQPTAPAVGIIATSGGTTPAPSVTWDFMRVRHEGGAALGVTPTTLSFGAVPIGSDRSRVVTLTHLGTAGDPDIVINDAIITNGKTGAFSHDVTPGTVLQAGDSLDVTILFSPQSGGDKSATLVLEHSGAGASSAVQLEGFAEFPGDAQASVSITPNGGINASTFTANSFVIANQSPSGQLIQSIRFDLSSSILPDMVFDPNGAAGDTTAKPFTPDSGAATVGLLNHVLSSEHDDGFDVLEVNFGDFGPGEQFTFSIDVDPTSIRGVGAPGPNETGSVSGLELTGSEVTVTFSDGTARRASTFRVPASQGGGKLIARTAAPPQPLVQLLGVPTTPVTLTQANQTVRISGPAGAEVRLLIVEGGLYTSGVPGGGFDLDPFEANTAIKITELPAVIGVSGFVDVPITLTKTNSGGGINHIVATIVEADGRTGFTSERVVVAFAPTAQNNQPPLVNAGPDASVTLPSALSLNGSVSDDGLPSGTLTSTWSKLSGPGTVSFANAASPVTTATFSAPGTYVLRLTASDGALSSFDDMTVTVNPDPNPPQQSPFLGSPFAVGQTIQAEDFDLGGQGVAYNDTTSTNQGGQYRPAEAVDVQSTGDTGGGYHVGWIIAGEWLEYTLDVSSAGSYLFEARVSHQSSGGTFQAQLLSTSGTPLTQSGVLTIPNTGNWQTFTTISAPVALEAGMQILRLAFLSNGGSGYVGNINWIRLTEVGAAPGATSLKLGVLAAPPQRITWNDESGDTIAAELLDDAPSAVPLLNG